MYISVRLEFKKVWVIFFSLSTFWSALCINNRSSQLNHSLLFKNFISLQAGLPVMELCVEKAQQLESSSNVLDCVKFYLLSTFPEKGLKVGLEYIKGKWDIYSIGADWKIIKMFFYHMMLKLYGWRFFDIDLHHSLGVWCGGIESFIFFFFFYAVIADGRKEWRCTLYLINDSVYALFFLSCLVRLFIRIFFIDLFVPCWKLSFCFFLSFSPAEFPNSILEKFLELLSFELAIECKKGATNVFFMIQVPNWATVF